MSEDDIKGRLMQAISQALHASPARGDPVMERLQKHGIKFEFQIHDEVALVLPDMTDEQMLVIIAELKLG